MKPLVAPRTERNLFFHRSAGGEAKQSGGLFWRGEPSPGGSPVPPGTPNSSRQSVRAFSFLSRNRLCAHRESRLLLTAKNNLVLPTSTWIKSCRGGSLCPPVFCAAGHTEFEQAVGACLFFHIPVSALAKSCGRRWNFPNSGTLLSATQTFPCKGNHTAPTD